MSTMKFNFIYSSSPENGTLHTLTVEAADLETAKNAWDQWRVRNCRKSVVRYITSVFAN